MRAKKIKAEFPIAPKEIQAGSKAFRSYENRDAMYKVATFLVDHYWGKPTEMADALGVLLLTWNNALYRYGLFDFSALEDVLREKMKVLKTFRDRDIRSFVDEDNEKIGELFDAFLAALKIADGKKKGTRSPVAVAKSAAIFLPPHFSLCGMTRSRRHTDVTTQRTHAPSTLHSWEYPSQWQMDFGTKSIPARRPF